MSLLYLYGLAAGDPVATPGADPATLGQGLAGEPLKVVPCGPGLFALAGEMPARPRLARTALAGHDETVRRLAALVPALLPARFGETAPDEEALRAGLLPRARQLTEALALVHGSVQMTLRVFASAVEDEEPRPSGPERTAREEDAHPFTLSAEGPQAASPETFAPSPGLSGASPAASRAGGQGPGEDLGGGAGPPAPGPGARYLAERRRLHDERRSLPEVAALRAALRPLLRAERVERHEAGRLLATAYDLVGRDAVEAYRAVVERESAHLSGYRVAASGPWPAYAFAPEAVP